MSRFVADKVYKMQDENNNLVISFVVSGVNKFSANMCVSELKEFEKINIEAKKYKSQRSIEQNNMLWALIEKISIATSGYKRKDDVEECYCNLLERANIKSKFVPCIPGDEEDLLYTYRIIKLIGERTLAESGQKILIYKCFKGSSTFDTKQMNELIELALDVLADLGVVDSEITTISEEYEKQKK